jgi:hypothetical protein
MLSMPPREKTGYPGLCAAGPLLALFASAASARFIVGAPVAAARACRTGVESDLERVAPASLHTARSVTRVGCCLFATHTALARSPCLVRLQAPDTSLNQVPCTWTSSEGAPSFSRFFCFFPSAPSLVFPTDMLLVCLPSRTQGRCPPKANPRHAHTAPYSVQRGVVAIVILCPRFLLRGHSGRSHGGSGGRPAERGL